MFFFFSYFAKIGVFEVHAFLLQIRNAYCLKFMDILLTFYNPTSKPLKNLVFRQILTSKKTKFWQNVFFQLFCQNQSSWGARVFIADSKRLLSEVYG